MEDDKDDNDQSDDIKSNEGHSYPCYITQN